MSVRLTCPRAGHGSLCQVRSSVVSSNTHRSKAVNLLRRLRPDGSGLLHTCPPYSDEDRPGTRIPTYAVKFSPHNSHHVALADEQGRLFTVDTRHESILTPINGERDIRKFVEFPVDINWNLHSNAINDLSWSPVAESALVTVSSDKTTKLLDIEQQIVVQSTTWHATSISAVDFSPNGCQIVTGSRDACIYVWDLRAPPRSCQSTVIRDAHTITVASTSASPKTFRRTPTSTQQRGCANIESVRPPVSTVGVGPRHRSSKPCNLTDVKYVSPVHVVSCADRDGVVKEWDLRRTYAAYTGVPLSRTTFVPPPPTTSSSSKNAFTCIAVGATSFYVSTVGGSIHAFNIGSDRTSPTASYVGCPRMSFATRIALTRMRDGRDVWLAAGSGDGSVYFWDLELRLASSDVSRASATSSSPLIHPTHQLTAFEPITATATGQTPVAVTCVAASPFGDTIIACNDEGLHKVWSLNSQSDVDDSTSDRVSPCSFVDSGGGHHYRVAVNSCFARASQFKTINVDVKSNVTAYPRSPLLPVSTNRADAHRVKRQRTSHVVGRAATVTSRRKRRRVSPIKATPSIKRFFATH